MKPSQSEFRYETKDETIARLEREIQTLHESKAHESHRAADLLRERELWRERSNLQLDITRAAVAIVAKPFQIDVGRIGQYGYRIPSHEFETLQRAVEAYKAYKALSEQENANVEPSE